jgi:LacI family transcriptional regulator
LGVTYPYANKNHHLKSNAHSIHYPPPNFNACAAWTAAHLTDIANAYITQNATKGITVRDVVTHLKVSRRLADLRFRECTGKSILEAILDAKFSEIKRQLTDTSTPIKKITASCGFGNEVHAKHLFKKRFGMTMRDWRNSHR